MTYLTEITPQTLEQLNALKEGIESGNAHITDIEIINLAINMLSNFPMWAYAGICLIGVVCIINTLKKSVKAAAMLCIIFGAITSSGIASNIALEQYTNKVKELIETYNLDSVKEQGKNITKTPEQAIEHYNNQVKETISK